MLAYVLLASLAFLIYYVFETYRSFCRNLEGAKQSGLPYVWTPVYPMNRFWLVTHRLWLPFIERLPKSWTEEWLEYMSPDFIWDHMYDAFPRFGKVDMYMVVSPGMNTVYVANADAISQITSRRNDFPKPTWMYTSVDLFGKNVVSTEGALWRHHRRITSPPFTEKNNHLVWHESLHQAQSMLTGWVGGEDNEKKPKPGATGPLKDVAAQAMRLSLHVISRAGFGVRLEWPHEEVQSQIPEGHALSYKDAMSTLLENIIVVMLTPKSILNNSPLKLHKVANQAFVEWGKYMHEMYNAKCEEVKKGDTREGMDLMGALVRGAGLTTEALNSTSDTGSDSEKAAVSKTPQLLSTDEILGNAFVFILAGHETAANTIHFSILYLAMHWRSQARLQADLDAILGDKPSSEWSYDDEMPKLFGSMCGAVMNEELRLIPPVVGIPKSVTKHSPQALTVGGKSYNLPAGASITMNSPALHRNPKYWPHTSEQDLDEFRPERWLLDTASSTTPPNGHVNGNANGTANANLDNDTYATEADLDFDGPDKRPDTASTLFRPPRGAYIPFSEGYRSCLGRRFAQVEILAVLAVIFKNWSVELDVSDYISDEELRATGEKAEQRKRDAWSKADARARDLLKNGMMTIITIQMRKDKVPLRFVPRGEEKLRL